MYERPGYGTLLGRIRSNVRAYIRKQLELPRQEIAEIIAANKRAAMWLAGAAALGFATLIVLVIFIVALVALIPREWLGIAVAGLCAGAALALVVVGVRARMMLPMLILAVILLALGAVAYLYLPQLVLAALLLLVALSIGTGVMGLGGYKRLELRGPTRSINSFKETVRWAKARLSGRTAS